MKSRVALALLVLGGGLLAGASRSEANVIFVTTTAQKITSTGGCSLQEAIFSANFDNNIAIDSVNSAGVSHFITTQCVAGSGSDRIVLAPGTVLLMNKVVDDPDSPFGPAATPMIDTDITIEANGSRLQWTGITGARAFSIAAAGSLTITNAYIRGFFAKGGNGAGVGGGGMGAGGAIYVRGGQLVVRNSTFDRNGAIGGNAERGPDLVRFYDGGGGGMGGAGGNGGNLDHSSGGGGGARGNGGSSGSTAGGGGGGTVRNGGNGGFIVGGAGGARCGGAAGNESHFSQNGQCDGGGGGGGSDASLSLSDGRAGNGAYGGGGGGGAFGDDATGGSGGFGGGGGSCGLGDAFGSQHGGPGGFGGGGGGCDSLAFDGPGPGGLFAGNGTKVGGGGAGLGGAIFSDGGSVYVENSTFTANYAVRGVGGAFDDYTGANGTDAGGAIFSWGGHTTVLNGTIYSNEGTGSGGGVVAYRQFVVVPASFPNPPQVVFIGTPSFTLRNTIVANNGSIDQFGNAVVAANQCSVVGFTPVGSGNLIQNNDGCEGVSATGDPLLGPLQVNAPGNTPTRAITAAASAAYNTADSSTSLAFDQRGLERPKAGGFDIGAYEYCVGNPEQLNGGCFQLPVVSGDMVDLTNVNAPFFAGGVSPPSGQYPLNSIQHLVATPTAGYVFVDWTGDPVGDPNSASTFIAMDASKVVFANFLPWNSRLTGRGSSRSAIAPARIDLTLLSVTSADHYAISRSSTTGGPYTLVGTSSTPVFSDVTAGLVNGGTYYYIFEAVDSNGTTFGRTGETMVRVPIGR